MTPTGSRFLRLRGGKTRDGLTLTTRLRALSPRDAPGEGLLRSRRRLRGTPCEAAGEADGQGRLLALEARGVMDCCTKAVVGGGRCRGVPLRSMLPHWDRHRTW